MPRSSSTSNSLDVLIGAAIRARRNDLGWSQADLASRIGVTYQQVQKYESGANRITVSTLLHIASILQVPPGSILPGLDDRRDTTTLTAAETAMVMALRGLGVQPVHLMRLVLDVADGIKAQNKGKGGKVGAAA